MNRLVTVEAASDPVPALQRPIAATHVAVTSGNKAL